MKDYRLLVEKIKNEKDEEKLQKLKFLLAKKKVQKKYMRVFVSFSKWKFIPNIIVSLLAFSILFTAYTDLQLNTSFNQRVTTIEPYTSQHEIQILKSQWARMKNRNDFENIDKQIDSIGTLNKIALPKSLLK